MASPFRIFRKNQKAMLAVLGVLVMGGFVVLPILMKTMDGGGARTNRVVVTCDRYGDLRESDLDMLRRNRMAVQTFLRHLSSMVTPDPRYANSTMAGYFSRSIGTSEEESVVETWLLAHYAEDLGLTVTDDAVEAFVGQLAEGKLDGSQIEGILANLEISVDTLYRLFRHELLAYRTQQLFQISVDGTTPARRWDYYKRLNRKIAIEAIEIPVEKFVAGLGEPDERELKEFFEKYRDVEQNPSSSEPGFRVSPKVSIEYFKADYEHLVEGAKISEDEILAYYEEHKDEQFKRDRLPSLDSEAEPKPDPATKEPDEKPQLEAPPETQGPAMGTSGPEIPSADESQPKETAPKSTDSGDTPAVKSDPKPEPAPKEPAEKPQPEAAPKTEGPGPSGPEIPSADEGKPKETAPKSTDSGDTSEVKSDSPFRLVSYQQEAAGQAAPAKPEAEQPEDEQPAAEQPADEKDTVKAPAGAEEMADGKSVGEVVDSVVGEESPAEESGYEPLEEVAEQIKRTLAVEKLNEKLTALQSKMSVYRSKRIPYQAGTETEKPEDLDFAKLAAENGLAAYKTDLISAVEARDLDIGKSNMGERQSFEDAAFGTEGAWRPMISQDDEGNYYLFWILERTEGRVPEFEDEGIRAEVTKAWKMIEARGPATEEAKRLAAEAAKGNSEKSLKETLPDQTVIQTEPFAWMTYGAYPMWMAQAPPSVSDIKLKAAEGASEVETRDAIVAPGSRFMRDVFVLEKGQIGVATNQPETAVYVVRVADVSPLPDTLWNGFLVDDYRRYSMVSVEDRVELRQAWSDAIKASAGLEWSGREPYRQRSR